MNRRVRSFAVVCMPARGHLAPTLPFVAALVRRGTGCGRRLDTGELDAAGLRVTVEAVAGDPAIRSAVDATSRRLATSDGPSDGTDALESLVGAR